MLWAQSARGHCCVYPGVLWVSTSWGSCKTCDFKDGQGQKAPRGYMMWTLRFIIPLREFQLFIRIQQEEVEISLGPPKNKKQKNPKFPKLDSNFQHRRGSWTLPTTSERDVRNTSYKSKIEISVIFLASSGLKPNTTFINISLASFPFEPF